MFAPRADITEGQFKLALLSVKQAPENSILLINGCRSVIILASVTLTVSVLGLACYLGIRLRARKSLRYLNRPLFARGRVGTPRTLMLLIGRTFKSITRVSSGSKIPFPFDGALTILVK